MAKDIIVVGRDGFPTALHLSKLGHKVTIVDNLSRCRINDELGTESLTPIASIEERLAAWHEKTGLTIAFERIDVAREFDRLSGLLATVQPDAERTVDPASPSAPHEQPIGATRD